MSVDYVSKDSCQKKQIAVKFFTISPIRRADDYAPYIKCFQILWPISWRASGFNAQYVARFLTWQKMLYFFTLNLLRNDLGNISLQCKDTPILECSKRPPIKYVSTFSECRRACGYVDVGMWPHQFLAATFTLFQSEGADYAHHILLSPPSFESHRHASSMSATSAFQ